MSKMSHGEAGKGEVLTRDGRDMPERKRDEMRCNCRQVQVVTKVGVHLMTTYCDAIAVALRELNDAAVSAHHSLRLGQIIQVQLHADFYVY